MSLNPVQKADDPIQDRNRNIGPLILSSYSNISMFCVVFRMYCKKNLKLKTICLGDSSYKNLCLTMDISFICINLITYIAQWSEGVTKPPWSSEQIEVNLSFMEAFRYILKHE